MPTKYTKEYYKKNKKNYKKASNKWRKGTLAEKLGKKLLNETKKYFDDDVAELIVFNGVALDNEMKKRGII